MNIERATEVICTRLAPIKSKEAVRAAVVEAIGAAITPVEVEAAVGGAYDMGDGRQFWIDGPVAREIARRVTSTPK